LSGGYDYGDPASLENPGEAAQTTTAWKKISSRFISIHKANGGTLDLSEDNPDYK
jgi:hypothetical protein